MEWKKMKTVNRSTQDTPKAKRMVYSSCLDQWVTIIRRIVLATLTWGKVFKQWSRFRKVVLNLHRLVWLEHVIRTSTGHLFRCAPPSMTAIGQLMDRSSWSTAWRNLNWCIILDKSSLTALMELFKFSPGTAEDNIDKYYIQIYFHSKSSLRWFFSSCLKFL